MPKDKVIAYFSKYRNGQNAASQHENGIPLVPKNRDDRKMLVDAGNKCVAPAKSRPKKRKVVKPLQLQANAKGGDGSHALPPTEVGSPDVAEAVLWSDQVYTVKHLVKQFDGQFPVIARVDDGHYREGVVDLARGQVLLVSGHGKQRRVLASNNSTETLLSIPVDYQMDVIVSSSPEEVFDFTTAVKDMDLPFTATVYSVGSLSNTSHGNLTGEKLTFISIKDTVFLRANSISRGWVDQSEILVIPELVQVQFLVSEGLRGGTEQEWHDYQGMFARCVRHLAFSSTTGFQGILLEGMDGNELLVASTSCLADDDTDPMAAQYKTMEAAKESKKQRIAYENLRLSVTNQHQEDHENNVRLNGEDTTNDYDDILLTNKAQFPDYDYIGQSETPEVAGEVLARSGLDRHPSNVRVVSCSNSTLDYRRPRDDRTSTDESESVVSTHGGAALDSSNELLRRQRPCSVISKTNSEFIDQVFDDIIDLNQVDQTSLVTTAENHNKALGLRNIPPTIDDDDNHQTEGTLVNLESSQAKDEVAGTSFVDDPKQKESTTADVHAGPISKVSVLQRISKFQSPSQPQTDEARPSGHPRQRLEGVGENKPADSPIELHKPPKSSGLDKPKSVITDKPKPGQINQIQPPNRPPSTVGTSLGDRPTVANGVQEELSKQPNRWQPPAQKPPEKPLRDPQHQTKINCSPSKSTPAASVQPPPPVSRTPLASKPLLDLNPNRSTQIQSIYNRKDNASGVPNTKPTPLGNPVIPAQRLSLMNRDIVIKSSADVPSELESLSVAGVSQCLELLRLDKHVTEFNRNAVDGRKLTDLNEKALEQQFHFNPLDASKLVRFVRGWRP